MGYHDAVGQHKAIVSDACRIINDRERYAHALRLCLEALEIDDTVIADIRKADFRPLKKKLLKIKTAKKPE